MFRLNSFRLKGSHPASIVVFRYCDLPFKSTLIFNVFECYAPGKSVRREEGGGSGSSGSSGSSSDSSVVAIYDVVSLWYVVLAVVYGVRYCVVRVTLHS